MTGTVGPGGSVRYVANPNSPSGYDQVTDLSPEQRGIYDSQTRAQQGALNTANDQIGRINTALGQQMTPPEMQTSYDPGASIQTGFSAGPGLQYGFNQGGQVQSGYDAGGALTRSFSGGSPVQTGFNTGGALNAGFDTGQGVQGQVGPNDFSADREAVTNSVIDQARSRLDPMWNQEQEKQQTRLSNQGLSQNSTAYQTAQGNFDRSRNDAYNQAIYSGIQAGSDQQQRLFDQSVQQGQFANNAAGQEYAQNMGAAQFGNDAALSDYGRNLGAAQFANQGAGQQYGQNMGSAQFSNEAELADATRNQQLAAFGNQAVGQRYTQNMGSADFRNTAAAQQFGQNQSAASFNNTAAAQQEARNAGLANFGNAARQQNFQNLAYSQNLPIEQFATLMGTGGGVQMPSAYNGPVAGVNGTDVMGAYALQAQQQQNAYNQQMQNRASSNQALGGLAGAVLGNWQNIF